MRALDRRGMATITLRVSGDRAKHGEEVAVADLSAALDAAEGLAWVDIRNPDTDERKWLLAQGYHEMAVEDCFKEPVTKAYVYDTHRFVVVRARDADKEIDTEFLCVFVTDELLVTVRHSAMPAVKNFGKRFGSKKIQRRVELGAEYLLYEILDAIADDWYRILRGYSTQIDELEDRVFDPNMKYPNMLQELHELKQDLREISKSVTPLHEVVSRMMRPDQEYITESCMMYWEDIFDVLTKLKNDVENYNAGAVSTRDTYLSQSTMRLAETQAEANDVIRILTILATLMFPITAIASIFGMNIEVFGASTEMFGFTEILGLMAMTSALILGFFYYRGWLSR
uniref:Magnesium transporter (CorA) n=1 Tax=uncultured marine group II/III euryarchaeote AD1000_74_G12 TaxID=1457807 RepID=A0A075FXZ4_9EURY|nr:magnesium transporter (corA) [uncultured marine group II/III euryarchaeote AD1000_74_G12]